MARRPSRIATDRAWRAQASRAGANRFRRSPPKRRLWVSGPSFVYLLCIALLIGWYGPAWKTRWDTGVVFNAPGASAPSPTDHLSARFGFCHSGGGLNCVVDGDTFWFRGQKVRVADIDAPETHGPRCPQEAALGARTTQRLQDLLNAGPFSLESEDRDTDRYGRALRIVTRGGASIGAQLVAEGLARDWDGARHPWC